MRNKVKAGQRDALVHLLQQARYEVLPTPTIEEKVLAHVPVGRVVTVTASPAKGLDATCELAESLQSKGYAVVPHIAARMVSGKSELSEICARLSEAGITRIFVPGGDAEGEDTYPDALTLLQDIDELGNPFAQVGVAGYPEPHPTISDDLVIQAMWDKRRYATHVVSNMTFDPEAVKLWISRMRQRGITMPLYLGIPGPVERTKLLSMATKIGVGESTRFLAKHKSFFMRLAAPGGFTGEGFLRDCLPAISPPDMLVEGLHIFTFNQVAETETWRSQMLAKLGVPAN